MGAVPRRTVETSFTGMLAAKIRELFSRVEKLERGASLRNSSISGGEGQKVYDDAGNLRLSIDTSGAVTAYGSNGLPAARYGRLIDAAGGGYGVEVLVNGTWVKLGEQNTTWDSIAGKPVSYPPSGHTHPGGDITSTVPQADGSQYGFNNTVSGTEFYALWVGNDGGFHFGRNTSSRKYKQNIRDHSPDPANVLKLRPVLFDRVPTPPAMAARDEWGLIAEEVQDVLPEAVQWFKGEIDGVRYEMIGLALIPVIKAQQEQINKLTAAVESLGGTIQ